MWNANMPNKQQKLWSVHSKKSLLGKQTVNVRDMRSRGFQQPVMSEHSFNFLHILSLADASLQHQNIPTSKN